MVTYTFTTTLLLSLYIFQRHGMKHPIPCPHGEAMVRAILVLQMKYPQDIEFALFWG